MSSVALNKICIVGTLLGFAHSSKRSLTCGKHNLFPANQVMEDAKEHQNQFHVEDDENEIVSESTAIVHGEPLQDAAGPPKVDSEMEILHEKEDKLEEAMQQYEMAIAYMGDDFMFQLFGKYRDMALAVKNPCHLNMAACLIKLKRYEEAIGHCSIVLSEDENNVKAMFRRGKARAELGQTDAAREDFLNACKYAPEDKAIARELRRLAEHDKAVYERQKEIYKGIFGPRPESKPKRSNWLIRLWQWLRSVFYWIFRRERVKAD
ncbi:Peptidyl-prolyl cis-trans isomerase FKBP42 [Hibiscus syriacus]|uniref:Peptidyl-prolyl cis-trans isomerase FKBP42 n=1 Tax=Hibiscus syriacus TaxID=106335 RepID=A0A6A3BMK0_HIBSY|nr:Peptidyl-prolyl cis-trans isomerase FKBP42 [Hibiscus syriacus]